MQSAHLSTAVCKPEVGRLSSYSVQSTETGMAFVLSLHFRCKTGVISQTLDIESIIILISVWGIRIEEILIHQLRKCLEDI